VSRDWRFYWDDMIEAAEKVTRYTKGMDAQAFTNDEKTRDAVLRNLEIIEKRQSKFPSRQGGGLPASIGEKSRGSGTLSLMPTLGSTTSSCGISLQTRPRSYLNY
jgi:hypothetical protein